MHDARAAIGRRLRRQASGCAHLGSPLYATLLQQAALDVEAGGPVWTLLRGHECDPPGSALALRLMGAVHRLVLQGDVPDLAAYYPSMGGDATKAGIWEAFAEVLREHHDVLRSLLRRPVQTNEVRRARALLGGFLSISHDTGLPLALHELGASAGLNLRWDHFRYDVDGDTWGDPASLLCLRDGFAGAHPSFTVAVDIADRRGCDIAPIDPLTPEGYLTLQSYIWPDQLERITQLRAAIRIAAQVPAIVERASAPVWLEERLREHRPGVATVVYHSIFTQYLSEDERRHLHRVILEAGRKANRSAPLAWLRMEPAGEDADVRLTLWPGGSERLLAHTGYHGQDIHWLAPPN